MGESLVDVAEGKVVPLKTFKRDAGEANPEKSCDSPWDWKMRVVDEPSTENSMSASLWQSFADWAG
ncbi:hypothetical protein PG996_003445 [Apiospora saccharicola]|uniref:Uncharacterized protein n=1 Tax=Apiospora saccharicola TaxID=335842 RepID=A0ABR1W1A4_9PEZI